MAVGVGAGVGVSSAVGFGVGEGVGDGVCVSSASAVAVARAGGLLLPWPPRPQPVSRNPEMMTKVTHNIKRRQVNLLTDWLQLRHRIWEYYMPNDIHVKGAILFSVRRR